MKRTDPKQARGYDDDDVDEFGFDVYSRKRLRVSRLVGRKPNMRLKKKKPQRPLPTKLPRSLSFEEVLSEKVWFSTLGSKGKGTSDSVGYVTSMFFHSSPEFEKSVVDVKQNRNGWIIRGSWPSSGRQIFDWEFDTWGERGGAVVVKFNMWGAKGGQEGQNYRTNVATVRKLIPKFLKKEFYPMKARMKQAVEDNMSIVKRANDVIGVMVSLVEGDLVTYDQFLSARQKKIGKMKIGPIRVSINDSVKIGKSKPRKVVYLGDNMGGPYVVLGALKKPSRGMRMEGQKLLFWTGKSFLLRPSFGSGKDVYHKPEEVKVV